MQLFVKKVPKGVKLAIGYSVQHIILQFTLHNVKYTTLNIISMFKAKTEVHWLLLAVLNIA
jgi:hypothetical protein